MYKSFAITYLRERADLTFLIHAGETEADNSEADDNSQERAREPILMEPAGKMPSWVPDWRAAKYITPLVDESAPDYPHYKATADSAP